MGLPDRAGGSVEAMPQGYAQWVADLKTRVRATQFRAARAANAEVIQLYWSVCKDIIEKQDTLGWGAKVVQRLSADMRREFPGQTGWSLTNLKSMRMFAEAFPDPDAIGQQLVGQLPWGHIVALLTKAKTAEERAWYARAAVEMGWSRNVMRAQIDSGLMARTGAAPSNFPRALDAADSDLAQQMVKDPYVFQHVGMVPGMTERALEDALMGRIQDTLLELGRGFALVGRQVPFAVDGTEYAVDLLLFHVEQMRYVVVELKVGAFEPAHAGQLGAYVAMGDDLLRKPKVHAPTVGLLLCSQKGESIVRYSLASTAAPMAVADWRGLPAAARAALPNAEELQAVVDDEIALRRAEAGQGPAK